MSDTTVRYTSRDLAKRAGVDVRAVRRWLAAGLVQGTPFRGPKTLYGPRHLDEVLAIVRFRADNMNYAGITRRLRALSDDALAAFLRPPPVSPPPASPPPQSPPELAPPPEPAPGPAVTSAPPGEVAPQPPLAPLPGGSSWERVVLLPGLELAVRSDAAPLVQRIARDLVAQYRME